MKVLMGNDFYPCESGKLIKDCSCVTSDGRFIPQAAKMSVRQDGGGFQHPGCYARSLGGCSHTLTREHFIPAACSVGRAGRPFFQQIVGNAFNLSTSWREQTESCLRVQRPRS